MEREGVGHVGAVNSTNDFFLPSTHLDIGSLEPSTSSVEKWLVCTKKSFKVHVPCDFISIWPSNASISGQLCLCLHFPPSVRRDSNQRHILRPYALEDLVRCK